MGYNDGYMIEGSEQDKWYGMQTWSDFFGLLENGKRLWPGK